MINVDIAKIYSYLSGLNISLNFDDIPTPRFIQERTSERSCEDWKVDKYALEVTQELGRVRRLYRAELFNFESKKREALTNNEKIKKIPTGKEREAAVEGLLEDDLRKIMCLENEMDVLKDLVGAIKLIQDNLKDTVSEIRVLQRSMESQINRLNVGTKDDVEVAELRNTLADLDKLEDEMTVEDVESSTEVQTDESSDEFSKVAHKTGTEESDQDAPVSTEPVADEVSSENALSSFLMDDSEDTEDHASEEETQEEKEGEVTQAEATATAPTNKEPAQATGSKPKLVTGTADLDLSDIGIDIDTAEITNAAPAEKITNEKSPKKDPVGETPPAVSNVETAEKKKSPPAEVKKAAPPPVPTGQPGKKVETSKKDITDIDLDDILNSLD